MTNKQKNLIAFQIFVLIALLPFIVSAFPGIEYQGNLENESKTPINETVNITFSLYHTIDNIEEIPVWTEPHSVNVENGTFKVELGVSNPLPLSALSQELYLGVKVGNDSEMSPRRKLTSVIYAIQSLTVSDGAITTSKLAPGAVTSDKMAANCVQAINIADGSISEEKFQNNLIMDIVRANDGPDSGIDAATLAGKQASDFVTSDDLPTLDDDGNFKVTKSIKIRGLKDNEIPSKEQFYGFVYKRERGVNYNDPTDYRIRDLILYYKMDETSGDKLFDGVSSLNTGKVHNAAAVVDGRLGYGRSLNGTDQYLTKEHDESIDFGYQSFTVSLWMKAETAPTDYCVIISKANERGDANDHFGWLISNTDVPTGKGLEFRINSGGTGRMNDKIASNKDIDVFDGEWHHIVAVRDQSSSTIYLYVDGIERASKTGVDLSVSAIDPNVSPHQPLKMGAVADRLYFKGTVDELAIFGRAFTATEVASFYNKNGSESNYEGVPYSDGGLYYKHDDGAETYLDEPDNRQEVFRIETGSISNNKTSWSECTGITGIANIRSLKPFMWSFTIGAQYVSNSMHMYYRLKCVNQETGSVSYIPSENGYHKYITTNLRYEDLTFNGVDTLPKGKYEVQFEVKNSSTYTFSWSGNNGDIVLIMW
ncbi:secreted protein containing LamG-like jellyroll fold domain protein [Candidatus Magnetomorum sp. HK-1]|nr:secreted protein containing LamG-like jellyroll fold domain protein [Candidatus Magnetomorum sp. HK-1]